MLVCGVEIKTKPSQCWSVAESATVRFKDGRKTELTPRWNSRVSPTLGHVFSPGPGLHMTPLRTRLHSLLETITRTAATDSASKDFLTKTYFSSVLLARLLGATRDVWILQHSFREVQLLTAAASPRPVADGKPHLCGLLLWMQVFTQNRNKDIQYLQHGAACCAAVCWHTQFHFYSCAAQI